MTWSLLRIWHVEILASVASHPDAYRFLRTSYCLTPTALEELTPLELGRRVEQLIEASYRKRNHASAQSGDTTQMWWLGYACEWVTAEEMQACEPRETVWVRTTIPIHMAHVDAAIVTLEAQWRHPRPGLEARPWQDAFSAFLIEADGAGWKLLRPHDERTKALFADCVGAGA